MNAGRFTALDSEMASALHHAEKYILSHGLSDFKFDIELGDGYSKRCLWRIGDLLDSQIVWEFHWSCGSSKEAINGHCSVSSDGSYLWGGVSDLRGTLGTEDF